MRLDSDVDRDLTAHYQAFLDGTMLNDCCMADEEAGCAEVMRRDSEGKVLVDTDCPRGYQTRMLWGRVELKPTEAISPEMDAAIRRQKAQE